VQEQEPGFRLGGVVQAGEDPLGALGDRVLDAAGGPIPVDGQSAAVALLPGGLERMRQQWQPPGAVVRGQIAASGRA
jgi:hypothetical protein